MYPNEKNTFMWPITNVVEIITSIHVCLIKQMNFGSKENGRIKLFLRNQSTNIMHPNEKDMFAVANPKISGYYYEYPCFSYSSDELWF